MIVTSLVLFEAFQCLDYRQLYDREQFTEGRRLNCLRFIDDITIIADSIQERNGTTQ